MTYTIRPLRADEQGDLEAGYQIRSAALRRDVPDFPISLLDFTGMVRYPWTGERANWSLAWAGTEPVGLLGVKFPDLDNLDNAYVDLVVHPGHRRRGVGRLLYRHAADMVRAEGRKRIIGAAGAAPLPGGAERSDAGIRFADAMGARPALSEIRRTLDLTRVDDAALGGMLAEAWSHAAGYSLVSWSGTTPEEYIDDVAMLDGRLMLDSPTGDLTIEPDKVDATRIRAGDLVRINRKRRSYDLGLRHDASGRLVAWTAIGFDADVYTDAWQQITIVAPDHRGHRLGLVTKLENLALVRAGEPKLRRIHTWNAEENSHMIAINEQMGFRAVDRWVDYQHDL